MVTVQLDDAVAAALTAKAAAQGLTLEAYLQKMAQPPAVRPPRRLTVEELDQLLDEEATTGFSPTGTFPRSELYSDHD